MTKLHISFKTSSFPPLSHTTLRWYRKEREDEMYSIILNGNPGKWTKNCSKSSFRPVNKFVPAYILDFVSLSLQLFTLSVMLFSTAYLFTSLIPVVLSALTPIHVMVVTWAAGNRRPFCSLKNLLNTLLSRCSQVWIVGICISWFVCLFVFFNISSATWQLLHSSVFSVQLSFHSFIPSFLLSFFSFKIFFKYQIFLGSG